MKYGLAPSESECTYGCNGWSEQKCGGPWRITIHKIIQGYLYEPDKFLQKEMLISQNNLYMAYLNSAGILSVYVRFHYYF